VRRLLLAACIAVFLHALLLGVKAEWLKGRVAVKTLPQPLTLSLQYQEPLKKAAVSERKMPPLLIPQPPQIDPTPPAPRALDAPETPQFTIPKPPPKKKQARAERPAPDPPKTMEEKAPVEALPENWMQIPEGPPTPVQGEAPATAAIAPEKEGIPAIPEKPEAVESVLPPPPLVEAVPAYRKNPAPPYPRIARRRGYEGTVMLEVLVNKRGRVEEVRLFQSSGYQVLDKAAMESVGEWFFEPALRGDQSVEMWVKVPIRFQLK